MPNLAQRVGFVLMSVLLVSADAMPQLPSIVDNSGIDLSKQRGRGDYGDGAAVLRDSTAVLQTPDQDLAGYLVDADNLAHVTDANAEDVCLLSRSIGVFPAAQKTINQAHDSTYVYFNDLSARELESRGEKYLVSKLVQDRAVLAQYTPIQEDGKTFVLTRIMSIEVKNPDGHKYTGTPRRGERGLIGREYAFGSRLDIYPGAVVAVLKDDAAKCLVRVAKDDNDYDHVGLVFWCTKQDLEYETHVYQRFLVAVRMDQQKVSDALQSIRSSKESEKDGIREILKSQQSSSKASQATSKYDAGQQPPGITREDLAKALPQLIAALNIGKTQEDKVAVMVGTPGSEVADSIQLLGFKGGDVITNINRSTIENVDQAINTFENVKNDSGFTVRIVREGQSSWMRINVSGGSR